MLENIKKKLSLTNVANIITISWFIYSLMNYSLDGGLIKMTLWIFTIKIDSFWLIITVTLFVIFLININTLSPLGRKSKKLLRLAKLPKIFDRAITVERSPDWGSDSIIITSRYGKFPHLRFDMRVINRTYHSYEAEEAKIKCFCGSEEVLDKEGTWDNNTKKSETFEGVTNLPVWGQGDGYIMFHVPIKKLYGDMTTWKLTGTVEYRAREPLIDDNQYANPEIDIELEYILSEKQILALKKEVDKALGEEV
jgi:hypothetical protein